MANEKLALTPYDVAVMTAVAQGLVSGVNRAQHPERAGEPALERGVGRGLMAAIGHGAAAIPTAYLTRNLGGLASGAAATLAGIGGGAALPVLSDKLNQVGHDMTGGHVRMAAASLAKIAVMGCEDEAGSMGEGKMCETCKKVHPKPGEMCASEHEAATKSAYAMPAMQPLPPEITMSAAAQPPPGSIPDMGAEMGSMGFGFKPPKARKPKEQPAMKTESKPAPKEEKGEEKEASDDQTFMSGFMQRWRKTSGKDMGAKLALFRGSGFGHAMKRNAA